MADGDISAVTAASRGGARTGYHHGDLRAALLAAALTILAEGEEPTLRAVTRRVGVSATAAYRHYPDKRALLAAATARGMADLRDAILTADRQAPAGAGVAAQALAYVRFAVANPLLFRLMFGQTRLADERDYFTLTAELKQVLLRRLTIELPERAGDDLVIGCWALFYGMALLVLNGLLAETDPDPLGGLVERSVATLLGEHRVSPHDALATS